MVTLSEKTQWLTGEELIQKLGKKSMRSLETIRKNYPNCVKKVAGSYVYNINKILTTKN